MRVLLPGSGTVSVHLENNKLPVGGVTTLASRRNPGTRRKSAATLLSEVVAKRSWHFKMSSAPTVLALKAADNHGLARAVITQQRNRVSKESQQLISTISLGCSEALLARGESPDHESRAMEGMYLNSAWPLFCSPRVHESDRRFKQDQHLPENGEWSMECCRRLLRVYVYIYICCIILDCIILYFILILYYIILHYVIIYYIVFHYIMYLCI